MRVNRLTAAIHSERPDSYLIDFNGLSILTPIESRSDTSGCEECMIDPITREVTKVQADVKNLPPRQDATQPENLTKLNSHRHERNIPVDENVLSFESKGGCQSKTGSEIKQLTGSIDDPDILGKLKKEYDKGDAGIMSCLSFLTEKIVEQKKANRQLYLRIQDEHELFRSLRDKVKKQKVKMYEILEANREAEGLSRGKTEDEQKMIIEHQRNSSAKPLVLKINQLR